MGSVRLTLVATPIGNLADVSDRARAVLRAADIIAAEDSRRVRKLLSALGIPAGDRVVSLHGHNERARVPHLVAEIGRGRHVALVSDAGMPTISDPGQALVAACADAGVEISVVPGPSAVVTALAVSGLPADRFVFEGFPPRKGRERRDWLTSLQAEPRTIVLFEAPTRVRATLEDLATALGPARRVVVCREMTKMFEQFVRGSLAEVATAQYPERGEMVVVVEGAGEVEDEVSDAELSRWLAARITSGDSVRRAVDEAVAQLGVRRNRAYRLALAIAGGGEGSSDALGE
ncbi:MAG: 16S rRNA (cytidine(1402)-2'-O)-methyltransferase [Acidimicrobiia bacterium]|nr:16S rRNA (cytidine(1402)-2'-O)-methyltransferase [Acidimicrobiia bacterium]